MQPLWSDQSWATGQVDCRQWQTGCSRGSCWQRKLKLTCWRQRSCQLAGDACLPSGLHADQTFSTKLCRNTSSLLREKPLVLECDDKKMLSCFCTGTIFKDELNATQKHTQILTYELRKYKERVNVPYICAVNV